MVAANPTTKSGDPEILDAPPDGNITVRHDGTDYYYVGDTTCEPYQKEGVTLYKVAA